MSKMRTSVKLGGDMPESFDARDYMKKKPGDTDSDAGPADAGPAESFDARDYLKQPAGGGDSERPDSERPDSERPEGVPMQPPPGWGADSAAATPVEEPALWRVGQGRDARG